MTVSISSLVREAAKGQNISDAGDIANRVFNQIPPEEYPEILLKILRNQVVTEIGRQRQAEVKRVRDLDDDDFTIPGGSREPEATVEIDFDAKPTFIRQDPKAARVIAMFWDQRVPVEDGSTKRMGDLTADDCRYLARVRYQQADYNYKMGHGYSKVAYELDRRGLGTLQELDAKIVHESLAFAPQPV